MIFLVGMTIPGDARALSPSETARILAGLDVSASASAEIAGVDLATYQRAVERPWAQYHRDIAEPMQAWARDHLASVPGETIFYPFAGADFTTVHHLYPRAGRYVLVALQPAGRVPDLTMSRTRTREILDLFAAITQDFGRRGFFVTEELNDQFIRGESLVVEGITPVLMLMAEREGYEVISVEPLVISDDGTDVVVATEGRDRAATWRSVRLELRRRDDGAPVTLDYVRLDLSNGGLRRGSGARALVTGLAHHRVVLKAASHLLQYDTFRTLRDAIVHHAPSVVQDESGLDYADLASAFDVRLYGRFQRVNTIFSPTMQQSLTAAYAAESDLPELPFAYGYRKPLGPAVQVGTRRP